jgi:hypothetical protein
MSISLTPGSKPAETTLATIQQARWVAVQHVYWDEQILDQITAMAPDGSLVDANPDTLLMAVFVAGELAQSLQTLGYLGRAARNLMR